MIYNSSGTDRFFKASFNANCAVGVSFSFFFFFRSAPQEFTLQ